MDTTTGGRDTAREAETRRRRIRDLTHGGERWIVSLRAEARRGGGWRGRLRFFLDEPDRSETVTDGLVLEGLAFEELVAQATALGLEELRGRLRRFRLAAGDDGRQP